MFLAIDEQHNLVRATEHTVDSSYYCPACKGGLIFKKGTINQSHFSHKSNSHCQTFSEGETAEHMEGKLILYDWFLKENTDVQLEAFIPELNQRPDLLIHYKETKVAIEYQCSPISIEKIRTRTHGYKKMNITVIWILGDKLKVSEKVRSTHFSYLTPGLGGNYYLFQLDRGNKMIDCISNLTSSYGKVNYRKNQMHYSKSLNELANLLTRNKAGKRRVSQDNRSKQLNYLHHMSYQRYEKGRRFFELLYVQGLSVDSLPSFIHISVDHEWMIATFSYQWKLMVILWIESHKINQVITRNSILRKIKEWERDDHIAFQCMPNVDATELYRPVFEYIETLHQVGILKKVGDEKWVCYKSVF